jgi:hypothetical protein
MTNHLQTNAETSTEFYCHNLNYSNPNLVRIFEGSGVYSHRIECVTPEKFKNLLNSFMRLYENINKTFAFSFYKYMRV